MNRWLTSGLVLLLCLYIGHSAHARGAQDLYMVEPITAEYSGEEPTQNREKALAAGKVQAFEVLLKRIVPPEALGRATLPTAVIVEEMSTSHRILSEKSSPQKYSAQISVRFSPTAVRAWLTAQNLPYQEQSTQETLAIPVVFEDGLAHVWDEGPWNVAWQGELKESKDQSLLLPLGDLDDVAALPANILLETFTHPETASAFTHQHLNSLKDRYHADDVVFVCIDVKSDGLHPLLWWPQKIVTSETQLPLEVVPLPHVEDGAMAHLKDVSPSLLTQIAATMHARLLAAPQTSALAMPEMTPEHWQEIPLATTMLPDIAGLEKQLRAIPGVSAVQMRELSLEGAVFAVKTSLGEDALDTALQSQGVVRGGDGIYGLQKNGEPVMAALLPLQNPMGPTVGMAA